MKWVTRGTQWVAGGLAGLGLAAPVSGAGAGEVGAPVGGVELTRGSAATILAGGETEGGGSGRVGAIIGVNVGIFVVHGVVRDKSFSDFLSV